MNIVVLYRSYALWLCSYTILLVGVKILLQYFHNWGKKIQIKNMIIY